MKKVILVRYGEIGLKGKNRYFFESTLMNNMRKATRSIARTDIQLRYGRIYIQNDDPQILQPLKKVFGLVGFSNAYQFDLQDPFEMIRSAAADLVQQVKTATDHTFRIETRRPNKHYELNSDYVNRHLGGAVLERLPELKVNLDYPDITLFVEIRNEGVFLYTNRATEAGPGGLPVGVSGHGLLLLSGGIDSPVAGWMMMKRGMPIDAVHFHSFPYTGEKSKEKAIDLARMLSAWKLRPMKVYVPFFTNIQIAINKVCREDYWTVLHRRFMMRITQKIVEKFPYDERGRRYQALVTGENLAQVASQTIENIAVISKATELPIIRPLIGFDKQDIVQLAEKIDTFRISQKPFQDCCTVFAPKRPHTKAREYDVLNAEALLDVDGLIEEAMDKLEIVTVEN